MLLPKNISLGKTDLKKIIIYLVFFTLFLFNSYASQNNNLQNVNFVELKILDKVSSKNIKLILNINEEKSYENLIIKILKCKNSEFDDNPEVTAYLQVRDITIQDNDKVFIFNGWTFSSSPSIRPFDHPVYDIWLKKCYS